MRHHFVGSGVAFATNGGGHVGVQSHHGGVVMRSQIALDRIGLHRRALCRAGECDEFDRMGRRRFLRRGIMAALALPALGVAVGARPASGSSQTAVVVILTGADPEAGVGGWIDTADGGQYDASQGVVTIPGMVGQSLGATVYRDDGCTRSITLEFQPQTTVVEVGGC
jgi:hypothetical protein